MYKDLGMNDTVNDKNFHFSDEIEFQSPKYADACQEICQAIATSRNVQIL